MTLPATAGGPKNNKENKTTFVNERLGFNFELPILNPTKLMAETNVNIPDKFEIGEEKMIVLLLKPGSWRSCVGRRGIFYIVKYRR